MNRYPSWIWPNQGYLQLWGLNLSWAKIFSLEFAQHVTPFILANRKVLIYVGV